MTKMSDNPLRERKAICRPSGDQVGSWYVWRTLVIRALHPGPTPETCRRALERAVICTQQSTNPPGTSCNICSCNICAWNFGILPLTCPSDLSADGCTHGACRMRLQKDQEAPAGARLAPSSPPHSKWRIPWSSVAQRALECFQISDACPQPPVLRLISSFAATTEPSRSSSARAFADRPGQARKKRQKRSVSTKKCTSVTGSLSQ